MSDRDARLQAILGIGQRRVVTAHPALIEQWLSFSEDKRTTGGWYVARDGKVGQVLQPKTERRFATIQDAVAEYVVLELDFWSQISEAV